MKIPIKEILNHLIAMLRVVTCGYTNFLIREGPWGMESGIKEANGKNTR